MCYEKMCAGKEFLCWFGRGKDFRFREFRFLFVVDVLAVECVEHTHTQTHSRPRRLSKRTQSICHLLGVFVYVFTLSLSLSLRGVDERNYNRIVV